MLEVSMMHRELNKIKRQGAIDIVNKNLSYCLAIIENSIQEDSVKELKTVTEELQAIMKFLRIQKEDMNRE